MIIDTEEVVNNKGKTFRLCKLRNFWWYRVWNSECSIESQFVFYFNQSIIYDKYLNIYFLLKLIYIKLYIILVLKFTIIMKMF